MSTMRVLVAEDDKVASHLVCGLIRKWGYVPVPAYDAMQTLMFAMRAPAPSVIVLDVNMPGGTGLDALRKLKASVKTALIPVVVLSGAADDELPARVVELGAEAFLPKPVDPEALLAALSRAVGAHA